MFFKISDNKLAEFRAVRLMEYLNEIGIPAELKTDIEFFGSALSNDNGDHWPMIRMNVNDLYLGYYRGKRKESVMAYLLEWNESGFNTVDSIEIPDLNEDLNEEYVMLHRCDVTIRM